MIDGLIPNRYAKALYKYAADNGATESVYALAKVVIKSYQDNSGMQKVMANPFVKAADKEKLLVTAAGKDADKVFTRFVSLVVAHHREEFMYLIMLAYRDIYRREKNISQVQITTATPLAQAETDKIKALVEKAFPKTTLEYFMRVNPDIIGGFLIDVDSVRMDASISNELEQLRLNLIRSN